MDFTPVRKVSTYELIVEQIERGVTSGKLRVGERLPGERQLMERFSVSRATVREAMRVLQATGVVESRPGDPRGPIVMPFTAEVLERPLSRLVSQEGMSRLELLQFRLMIEGEAALLAAARRTEEHMAQIDASAQGVAALADLPEAAPAEFGLRVNLLHAAIREASGNQLIQTCGDAVGGALAEIVRRRLEADDDRAERLRRSAVGAIRLAGLLRDGDPKGARRAAMTNIYRYYQDALTDQERAGLEPMVAELGGDTEPAS